MSKFKIKLEKFGISAIALLGLTAEIVDDITGLTSLRGRKGVVDFARKLNMGEYQLASAIRSLEREGFIDKIEDGYLITPKGLKKSKKLRLQSPVSFSGEDWDGNWRIVIFDIPEIKRSERNIFRSILKRKGFIRLQNSVFVCPYADFSELNVLRHEYHIEKYVNFLIAKSDSSDDDTILKNKFGLSS